MIHKTVTIIKRLSNWFERCRIRVYAAQASFFVIISAFPFIMLLLSILGTILPRTGQTLKTELYSVIPSNYYGAVSRVLNELELKSSTGLMSISAVVTFWASSRGVKSIGEGIRNVIPGDRKNNLVQMWTRSFIFTVIYILSVIATLLILVFGDLIRKLTGNMLDGSIATFTNGTSVFIALTLIFALTYLGYSGRKIKFSACLAGALFASLGWLLFSWLFEIYVENFAYYSYLYGSLTSIIVVMLWFYTCSQMLLIGAGVAARFSDMTPIVTKVEIGRKG